MSAVSLRMPSASFVVARSSETHVIGCENALPWHLPSDLKHFKNLTQGHVVVMGRKTLDSIGKPLPNRTNIVVSREDRQSNNQIIWARNPTSAVLLADFYSILMGKDEFFVIGGDNIYKELFKEKVINKVYLTEVFCNVEGDSYFKFEFPRNDWKWEELDPKKDDFDEYNFRLCTITRKKIDKRFRLKSEFLTCFEEHAEFRSKFEKNEQYYAEHMNSERQEELFIATG